MTWTKLSLVQRKLFVIALVPVSFLLCPLPLQAQIDSSISNSSEQLQVRFIPAKPDIGDRGTPPTNQGTGSRGDCLYKAQSPPLTGLTGADSLELTVNEHPTFWFYVPYTPQEAPSGEFTLHEGDNEVYRTRFQLPATPGIVSVSLPSTTKSLEIGKTYRWYFAVNCPGSESSDKQPAFVTGVVERVARSPALETELNAAKMPLERIAAYAKHHLWYETLTELAQLRLKEPQNPTLGSVWVELLSDKNVGLNRVTQQPIVGSVKTNSPPR